MTIYDQFGRLSERLETESIEHRKTISLLQRIKSGEVSIDDVEVTSDGWRIVEDSDGPVSKIG